MSLVILTPETNNSTACVIVRGPGAPLYIQALDAYGYQRELVLKQDGPGFVVHCYQHPGRRIVVPITAKQADRLANRIEEICERYPHFLFNGPGEDRARCAGFVTLQEGIFRGIPFADILSDYI